MRLEGSESYQGSLHRYLTERARLGDGECVRVRVRPAEGRLEDEMKAMKRKVGRNVEQTRDRGVLEPCLIVEVEGRSRLYISSSGWMLLIPISNMLSRENA